VILLEGAFDAVSYSVMDPRLAKVILSMQLPRQCPNRMERSILFKSSSIRPPGVVNLGELSTSTSFAICCWANTFITASFQSSVRRETRISMLS
jgi:hypothetical protein